METEKKRKNNKMKKIVIRGGAILLGSAIVVGGLNKYELSRKNNFERVVQADGSIDLENTGNYLIVRDYEIVEIETVYGSHEVYMAEKNDFSLTNEYRDIFTGKRICSNQIDTKFVKSTLLEDYLIAFGMLKEDYSKKDLEEVYQKIIENYTFGENTEHPYTKSLTEDF